MRTNFCTPLRILVVMLALSAMGTQAQVGASSGGLWREVDRADVASRGAEPWIQPANARLFALETALLKSTLAAVPKEFSAAAMTAPREISVPLPDGTYARFTVEESPVMHPVLAAKFPDIRTFIGRGLDDPAASARFDWTVHGFHAQILKPSGAVYIDPAERGRTRFYSSYAVKDYRPPLQKAWTCLVQGREGPFNEVPSAAANGGGLISGETLRTYRLALACTGEYAFFHGGTVNGALGAMVTTVNRVTGIYEMELAVRMELVPDNDQLIFLNALTDPYANNDGATMLAQNRTTVNGAIGFAAYDIGHVFSTGGGGIAGLGVVCGLRKAEGVTGRARPVGDPFDVDFVAHEMGHQFGGDHTFNGDSGSCSGGNRNGPTAYEPGSGSTIQAYAGICGNDDIQPSSDPYFHSESHAQIYGFVSGGGGAGCAVETPTGNNPPTVNAGADYIIPRSTPFELTASGSDVDGDPISYSWEERDLGPQRDVNAADNGRSPLFRFWPPTALPTRTFPRLDDLVNNTTVVGETLPAIGRVMNFRCTVRDHRAGGGGVSSDDMVVTVAVLTGPFAVTFPNTPVTLSGRQTVTWDVAGTSGGAVNTPNVDILLSTDGGMTYPILLAQAVPNNGSTEVILPDIHASSARIKIRGSGNIFFDISNVDFVVEPASGLSISPIDPLVASGLEGGGFTPNCRTYELHNETGGVLSWDAGADASWVGFSPPNGSLPPDGRVEVAVCIQPSANALTPGDYAATATFTNLTGNRTHQRSIALEVIPIGGLLQFSSPSYVVEEGGGAATVTVHRVGDTSGVVGVDYATADGSASQGTDYVQASGTLVWGAGDTSPRTIMLTVVDDTLMEPDETVVLTLSVPTGGATLGTPSSALLTLLDDDSNDTCEGARLIAAAPFATVQNTDSATSLGDPVSGCASNSGNGVWYRYTAPANGNLTVDTAGSSYDTVLTFYAGSCGGLTEVACDDDSGPELTSSLSLIVSPGTTYTILASGYNSAVGTLALNASFLAGTFGATTNDLCANAIVVPETPFLNLQSTHFATSEGDPELPCSSSAGNGVWYRFTAPHDGFLIVDLEGSEFDTAAAVYGGSCGALTPLDCNDDRYGGTTSITETFLPGGTTVYILCAGYENAQGELSALIDFAGCSDDIQDGDFEAGSPWPAWTLQSSSFFDTPLYDQEPGETFAPLSGSNWSYFYGPGRRLFTEEATLGQTVIFPVSAVITLRYQLWIGYVEDPFTDTLDILVDDVIVDTISEPDTGEFFYTPETIDLSAFADGLPHTIQFRFENPAGGGESDWNIDDIQLKVCLPDFDGDGIPDVTDPDDDNDRVPDAWEDTHGMDSRNPADAGLDLDGDGATGREEFVADTSPVDTLSVLKLRIDPRTSGSDTQPLSFDSSASRTYYIQYRPDLLTGPWFAGPTNIPGNGAATSVIITNDSPALHFRVGAELP